MTVLPDRLHGFVGAALGRAGLSAEDAATGADVLVTTDAWGVFTHGTKLLHGYLRRLQAGGLKADGRPGIVREGPAWALVDGQSSLAMVTSVMAMRLAIAKARVCGLAYV
ncbi:MAG: Ldh family oxidoreductase, partial [Verrucomicrobiota bacterium]